MTRADVEAQLVEIGAALSGRADALGRDVAAAIREGGTSEVMKIIIAKDMGL
jgi:hypothetical protein